MGEKYMVSGYNAPLPIIQHSQEHMMGQYYSQLTVGERNQFYALRKAQIPMTDIATQLNRSRTTLYNELARNTGQRGYRPRQAQQLAEQRKTEKVQPHKMTPNAIT
jgi:IS30 family transposase